MGIKLILIFVVISFFEINTLFQRVVADDADICYYKRNSYMTDAEFTCCGGQKLIPGIRFTTLNPDCLQFKGGTNAEQLSIVGAAWRVYDCIIRKELGVKKKPLTFRNFAEIITDKYPQEIKAEILKNATKLDSDEVEFKDSIIAPEKDDFDDGCLTKDFETCDATISVLWKHKALIAIRNAYYFLEKEVCDDLGMRMLNPNQSYVNMTLRLKKNRIFDTKCFSWREWSEKKGDCCNGIPIPIPLVMHPYIPSIVIQNFTLQNVTALAGPENNEKNLIRWYLELCSTTSFYLLSKRTKLLTLETLLTGITEMKTPNYDSIVEDMIPKYYPPALRSEMGKYLLYGVNVHDSNYTGILHVHNSTENFLNETEFRYRPNMTKFLLWHCSTYRTLKTRMMEFNLVRWCGNPHKKAFNIDWK